MARRAAIVAAKVKGSVGLRPNVAIR
jgi:hypothetical protein